MTADERIDAALVILERMVAACCNCRGSDSIRVLCIAGTREERCHVCAPLRRLIDVLAGK